MWLVWLSRTSTANTSVAQFPGPLCRRRNGMVHLSEDTWQALSQSLRPRRCLKAIILEAQRYKLLHWPGLIASPVWAYSLLYPAKHNRLRAIPYNTEALLVKKRIKEKIYFSLACRDSNKHPFLSAVQSDSFTWSSPYTTQPKKETSVSFSATNFCLWFVLVFMQPQGQPDPWVHLTHPYLLNLKKENYLGQALSEGLQCS